LIRFQLLKKLSLSHQFFDPPSAPQKIDSQSLKRSPFKNKAILLMTQKSKEEILSQLLGSERLIIIYGPPGCGKTRYILGVLKAVDDFGNCGAIVSKRCFNGGGRNEIIGTETQQFSYHQFLRNFYDKENIIIDTPLTDRMFYILDDFHYLSKAMRLVFDNLVHHLTHSSEKNNQKIIVMISCPPSGLLKKILSETSLSKNFYQFNNCHDGTKFSLSLIESDEIIPCQPDCEIIYSPGGDHETVETPQRYYRIADIVCERVFQTIPIPKNVYEFSPEPGACLVFLPGKTEVSLLCELLQSRLEGRANIVPFVERYEGCEKYRITDFISNQNPRNFYPQTENMSFHTFQKKSDRMTVYLSDGAAASGPYIPNVTMIIDSMVTKDETDDTNNIRHYNSRWISQDKLKMRMFRFSIDFTDFMLPEPKASPERKFVILGSKEFCNTLPKEEPDAYHYFSIEHDILEMIYNNIDPYHVFPKDYHHLVDQSMKNFRQYGLIDGDELCLEMTRFVKNISLEIRMGSLLWTILEELVENKTVESEMSIIQKLQIHTAAIATIKCYSGGIVRWPRRNKSENFYDYSHECDLILNQIGQKYAGRTSMETIYKIWDDIYSSIDPHNYHELRSYCNNNNLLYRRFDMMQALMRKLFCKCVQAKRLNTNIYENNRNSLSVLQLLNWADFDDDFNCTTKIQRPSVDDMSREMFRAVKKIYSDLASKYKHTHTGGLSIVIDGNNVLNDERFIHNADLVKNKSPVIYPLCITTRILRKKKSVPVPNPKRSPPESDTYGDFFSVDKDIIDWENHIAQEVDETENSSPVPQYIQTNVIIKCLSIFHADPDEIDDDDDFIDI
jgi:hypothetical protein